MTLGAISKMTIRLVDKSWSAELADGLRKDASTLRIISPFIKVSALDRLLSPRPRDIYVITRFNLADFADGVSDISALRRLLAVGATVRGIKNLHSKMYLFGATRAIVTSANLTQAALDRNHEFGIVSDDNADVEACQSYFDRLWRLAATNLSLRQVDEWTQIITEYQARGLPSSQGGKLKDFGAKAGINKTPPISLPAVVANATQAFVKFFGEGNSRVFLSTPTYEEIKRSGCHWAAAYPAARRPTGVKDEALIFIGRLTKDPNDIRIFGRAIGMKHVAGRDDASPKDIQIRPWKAKWPRYIRLHHSEFVAGTLANGVSLNKLMEVLGPDSFSATQRNAAKDRGNTDPRIAYRQQAAVQLSPQGLSWLSERLQSAFDMHGLVPQDELDKLDRPTVA